MIRSVLTLICLSTIAFTSAHAEEAKGQDLGLAAMKRIAFLAGEWEGEGWMQRGPERGTFTSTETVESRLDGRVLIVEGLHHAPGGEIVHHALAVVSHDPETGGYRFRSHLADGTGGDYDAELVDGAFVWGFATDRGRVRFTIRIEGDEWHEEGHFSPDGGDTWIHFFQMDLTRTAGR